MHGQERRPGVVVHGDALFATNQSAKQLTQALVSPVALAAEPVHFQNAERASRHLHTRGHLHVHRSTTQASVEHHATHVDRPPQAPSAILIHQRAHGEPKALPGEPLLKALRVQVPNADLLAPRFHQPLSKSAQHRSAHAWGQSHDARIPQDFVHGGQEAVGVALGRF